MKLQIEIGDYTKDGGDRYWITASVLPTNGRGIPIHDKPKQLAKFDRLTDLSEAIAQTVERFYHGRTISSPSNPSNTSGEPGIK